MCHCHFRLARTVMGQIIFACIEEGTARGHPNQKLEKAVREYMDSAIHAGRNLDTIAEMQWLEPVHALGHHYPRGRRGCPYYLMPIL
jgi:hypothetical protein